MARAVTRQRTNAAALPEWVAPQLTQLVDTAPDGLDWLHEIKYDGYAFVVTAERFREVEARLKTHGIDYIGPIAQLPGLLGIYFDDPTGIRLEFACQPEDGEDPAVIPCVTQTKAEARAELATLPGITPEWIEMRRRCSMQQVVRLF